MPLPAFARRRAWPSAFLLCGALLAGGRPAPARERGPAPLPPPPPEVARDWRLSPFYRQYVDAGGLPVVGSGRVAGAALREAARLVDRMLAGRDDVRRAITAARVRLAVMAVDERTTMVPEHADLKPAQYWDRRARGLGATRARPAVSCGEENLLGLPGDPYRGESILIHEFAHVVHQVGLGAVDPAFGPRLREVYGRAQTRGLWRGTYADTNTAEYWAEGVQSWFDCNQTRNAVHNGVRTREQLAAHDPELSALIEGVFPVKDWRWSPPAPAAGEARRVFRWEPELSAWYRTYETIRGRHTAILRGETP